MYDDGRGSPPAEAAPSGWLGRRRRPPRDPLAARRRRAGLLFTLPVVALVGVLLLYPIGQTIYHSFTVWDGLTSHWVGTASYRQLFGKPEFVQVLENNALLVLSIPVAIAFPLGVAFLIQSKLRGWQFFRSVFFLPTAVSWVVIAYVAIRFFADDGILQHMLNAVGLGFWHPNMLSHERSALIAVMITFVWSMFGTNLIIFLAGMATIDQELYDAARVDGAGSFTVLTRITVPLLRRFIQFAFIITLIAAFTALFSLIFVMTSGGPGYGTTTLEFFIYEQAFQTGDFGLASTAGVVLFLAVAAVGLLQLRIFRSED
ncbi:MAG: carbohydrate ABC transporter permease [Syntrophomonadaceae bacterium]